jgi:phage terminase Nu1 subunit (DNA packaging protein)
MATQSQIAEHLDMTPQRVRDLIKQGVLNRKNARDSMDIDECRKNYIRYLRTRSQGLQNASGDLNEERTRLTKLQADKAQLEVQEMEESLVSVEKITEEWVGYVANVRSKLLALPSKVSHRVQAAETYAEAEKILKESVYDALHELSNNGL